ncbi:MULTISPECIES: hypothetical protein [unclassified Streptomyces]|uniref:hypothetical protein n=1 Tax=unclassified Streptomyces TaxID=2593676 RepID=UPI003426F796
MTSDRYVLPPRRDEQASREYPLEYDAFRQLNQQPYLRYACLRTGDPVRAERSVSLAFAALYARWPDTLRSPCPAAAAWEILHTAVDVEGQYGRNAEPQLPCVLTAAQADAVRLHDHLGLSVYKTAALMGTEEDSVRALLRSAARTAGAVCARASRRA